MEFSDVGLALLKRSEGLRLRVYSDIAGLPTIGYGHQLMDANAYPNGIDEAFAEKLLAQDVQDASDAVKRLVTVDLTQGQFDALVDFVFNLGASRFSSSTLLKDLNAGRYEDAAEQLLRWDHAGQIEVAGLKARRQAELALWNASATE